MDYQLAINDKRALRMWAAELAQGDLDLAARIEVYVSGDGDKPEVPIAVAAE